MKCERCGQETNVYTMSWFNTQNICEACREKEQAHPQFAEAKQRVLEKEKQGNLNYEGIGLPEDLK